MSLIRLLIMSVLLILCSNCFSQQAGVINDGNNERVIPVKGNEQLVNIGDSVLISLGVCKNRWVAAYKTPAYGKLYEITPEETTPASLFAVHGNILYSFNYRSYIDTPFAQHDLVQQLVQTNFNLLVSNKYPVRVTITSRNSNSPYFSNATDVSLQFSRNQLLDNIKSGMVKQLNLPPVFDQPAKYAQLYNNLKHFSIPGLLKPELLNKYENELLKDKEELNRLSNWLTSPARMQEIVEEKERALIASSGVDVLTGMSNKKKLTSSAETAEVRGKMMSWLKQKKDSSDAYNAMLQSVEKVTDKMADVKSRMAKLKDSIQAVEKRLATAKKNITDTVNKIRKAISTATNPEALYTAMEKSGISKDQLTRAQRFLLSVRQVGIGRSWIDYSELTVKNISIAGFNIEMNPSRYYLAFAAGKVNYRFRDFIYNNNKNNLPNQSVALMRAGIGRKEKNNVIVTFYDGKKSVLNSTNTAAFNAVQHILGVSVEARYALDANNYLTAEIAKSSYYSNAAQQPRSSDLTAKLFNLKESSNQAYSVKLNSYYPQSNTRFTGFYKKLGENFQSFTLYPAGTNQEAWMARFNQLFWKKRLTLDAAIRKNDFVSPVAAPSFNSKNIFKSLQATLRVPKYPFVSVGYFPSSQLSLSNNNILTESQYNTLNAVVSHSYLFKQRLSMNTNLLYTKFFNSGSDTGFIYFNAASWSVNHSIFISQLQFQSGLTVTDQQQLHLVTLEQQLSWQARKTISFSAGLKWTIENHDKNLFGGTAAMSIYLKRLGNLLFHYDKTYLPGYNRTLVPVDIGQFSFYREF